VIIDTDVLIWYLRGDENAQKTISDSIPFKLSVISYMELLRGMKNKNELRVTRTCLKKWSTEIIQINENISSRAMFFMEDYCLSHSMEYGDAVIAATALEYHEILLTANYRRYGFIPNIQIRKFRPKR